MAHYDETKNRFNPENRFVGDIEDGKRYPFACYTKEESDERYAAKSVETTVAALVLAVDGKASEADFEALSTTVTQGLAGKADESECVDIRARLDALEYKFIDIKTFEAAPPINEIGSSQTIALSWTLNKAATSQNINNVPVTGSSSLILDVTSTETYTLNVSDGLTSASKSVTVSFMNRVYYGAAANLSSVTSLTSVLSNDPERTITVTAGSGQYIIYAIPARLGNVVFYVGGFEGGFENPVEQTLTNSSGYSETYKVYRSTNSNLGETTVEIKEA